jgi:hypothetical protein
MERAMGGGWRLFVLSVAVFVIAFGAERWLVPGIVPIGFAEEPQSSWAVQTAFVLRAIELMAAGVAIASLSVMLGAMALRRRKDAAAGRTLD